MSIADAVMIGVGAWIILALGVVVWIDKRIKNAPLDPNDPDSVPTQAPDDQEKEKAP